MSSKKCRSKIEPLDYHEGLSPNQVKIILKEFGLGKQFEQFADWMSGQTCPMIPRYSQDIGEILTKGGVYEYDLFRWIDHQRSGAPLIFD